MLDIITFKNYKVLQSLLSLCISLGVLFTLISTTSTITLPMYTQSTLVYTTSAISSTMYTQSTLVYSTVISTSSTTDTSCATLCTAGILSKFNTYKI